MRSNAIVEKKGTRYGHLTVLGYAEKRKNSCVCWRCKCDCGKTLVVRGTYLRNGHTTSCGCRGQTKKQIHMNYLMASYREASAKARGLEWAIPKKMFWELVQSNCFYCGSPPQSEFKVKKDKYGILKYNGIDRLDSSKGYTAENVVPCCPNCNRAKWEMSVEEFRSFIELVYNNFVVG